MMCAWTRRHCWPSGARRYAEPTAGWDFSTFAGSIETDDPPWSYDDLAREALAGATSALDIGTGGGEVLLRLRDALPADTLATEGWAPNLPHATEALAPHGIHVVPYDSEHDELMPFEDGRFDVVLDRHESYVATEVFRVLRPGGVFVTQQVDGRDFEETHALFGGTPAYSHVTLENFRAEAEAAGFVVEDGREWSGHDAVRRRGDVRELRADGAVGGARGLLGGPLRRRPAGDDRARPGLHASDVRAGVSTSRPVARSPHSTSTTSRGFR